VVVLLCQPQQSASSTNLQFILSPRVFQTKQDGSVGKSFSEIIRSRFRDMDLYVAVAISLPPIKCSHFFAFAATLSGNMIPLLLAPVGLQVACVYRL
jgi:hypothetical protein